MNEKTDRHGTRDRRSPRSDPRGRSAPLVFNDYWVDVILTQTFIMGIAAASLIFLAAYGGMISLAQTALMGSAGFMLGNMVTTKAGGESKGLILGWNPTLALVLALLGTTVLGLLFGALAARSTGIYFLMITLTLSVVGFYFVGQVTVVSGFSGIAGINQYTPVFVGDIVNNRDKLYYIALGVAIVVYVAIRLLIRTPFGLALQGLRDEPVRMSSLGYAVPLHRMLAFGFASFLAALAGVLLVWWQGQIAPGDIGLQSTIDLLIIAVIGGLTRIEGAWVGALAFIVINNYIRDSWLTDFLDKVRHRRQLQHNHRTHFSRHSDRLTRWAHGSVGQAVGVDGTRRWRRAKRHDNPRRREGVGKEGSQVVRRGHKVPRSVFPVVDSQPRRATGMSRFTRHWKLALPLGVLVILATVIASSSVAASRATDGQGRDHDRLQGRLRVRLRAGHRRRSGGIRELRTRQGEGSEEAVGRHDGHPGRHAPPCRSSATAAAMTRCRRRSRRPAV